MRVVWSHNWFLDYRVPVYEMLAKDPMIDFHLIYCPDNIPKRVDQKIRKILGEKAVPINKEIVLHLGNPKSTGDFANRVTTIRIPLGLFSHMRALKPDVIVSEGFFRWSIFNLIAAKLLGCKFVMLYERTPHTERGVSGFKRSVRKFLARRMDVICGNGVLTRDYLRSLGVPDAKITLGHMVADTEGIRAGVQNMSQFERASARVSLAGDADLVCLFVGQLNERKGIKLFLQGWRRYCEKVEASSPVVLVIGDGPQREKLSEEFEGYPGVRFFGPVDYDALYKYFAVADIFVMPTLEDNWSMVVPEAMAAGLPILTSVYNGCHPDLISTENGWVYDPYDEESLFSKLDDIFEAKKRLPLMGSASSTRILNHGPTSGYEAVKNSCSQAISDGVRC